MPINASAVYVDDSQAVYGASIQLVHTTSGDVFPLGSVDSDSTGWFYLANIGLPAGQTFTVNLQASQGGAVSEPTVITYVQTAKFAAAYAGSNSLKDPSFKYIGLVAIPVSATSKASIVPNKVSAVIVKNNVVGGGSSGIIQAITSSGTFKTLGPTRTHSTGLFRLKGKLEDGLEFYVGYGNWKIATVENNTALDSDSSSPFAAQYVLQGWSRDPKLIFAGLVRIVDLPKALADSAIKVKSVHVNDVNAPYGATIQLVHTTSGDSFTLGPIKPDGKADFPLDQVAGLAAGQTFTITLQADEGGARADTTIITYDAGSPHAAAYSGGGSLKDPSFKYIGEIDV